MNLYETEFLRSQYPQVLHRLCYVDSQHKILLDFQVLPITYKKGFTFCLYLVLRWFVCLFPFVCLETWLYVAYCPPSYVVEDGLKILILLPLPSRCTPSWPAFS